MNTGALTIYFGSERVPDIPINEIAKIRISNDKNSNDKKHLTNIFLHDGDTACLGF
jgi:hypothetical protein